MSFYPPSIRPNGFIETKKINNMNITLRKGSKGNEVKELQKILGITSDGDFGKKTEAALKNGKLKTDLLLMVL